MKKYIIASLLALVLLFGSLFATPKALASDISIRDFLNILILIGVIPADKVAAVNAYLANIDKNESNPVTPVSPVTPPLPPVPVKLPTVYNNNVTVDPTPITDPVMYLSFENSTADVSSNSPVTNIGNPSYTTGKIGSGLITGEGQAVMVADSGVLQPQKISIAAWIKVTADDNDGKQHVIVSKEEQGIAGGYYLGYGTQLGDVIGLNFKLMGGQNAAEGYYNTIYPITLQPDTWYHVVGTYDGVQRALFVNGVQVSVNCIVDGPGDADWNDYCRTPLRLDYGSEGVFVGSQAQYLPHSFWSGVLDEVRIYNRALSADEIAKLAN